MERKQTVNNTTSNTISPLKTVEEHVEKTVKEMEQFLDELNDDQDDEPDTDALRNRSASFSSVYRKPRTRRRRKPLEEQLSSKQLIRPELGEKDVKELGNYLTGLSLAEGKQKQLNDTTDRKFASTPVTPLSSSSSSGTFPC